MTQSSATEPASVAKRHADPEAFDDDLEWLLVAGDAAMGERGTLAGTISVLEHGGQLTGTPNTDLYSDAQIGWGTAATGSVERHRWLVSVWQKISPETRAVLTLCYSAPRAEHRGDELSGARSGAEAQLGRYAALTFQMTEIPGELLEACRQPRHGKNGRTINRELKKARDAAVAAHRMWSAAKGLSGKPRKLAERRTRLPVHEPVTDGNDGEAT